MTSLSNRLTECFSTTPHVGRRCSGLTPSTSAVSNYCSSKAAAPYWSNPPFFIFDNRALWRSGLSARAPEYQKLKMVGETTTAKCKGLTGSAVKELRHHNLHKARERGYWLAHRTDRWQTKHAALSSQIYAPYSWRLRRSLIRVNLMIYTHQCRAAYKLFIKVAAAMWSLICELNQYDLSDNDNIGIISVTDWSL